MHPKLTTATALEIRLMTSPGHDEAHNITDPEVVAQFAAVIDATSDQPGGSIPRGMETVSMSFTDATKPASRGFIGSRARARSTSAAASVTRPMRISVSA